MARRVSILGFLRRLSLYVTGSDLRAMQPAPLPRMTVRYAALLCDAAFIVSAASGSPATRAILFFALVVRGADIVWTSSAAYQDTDGAPRQLTISSSPARYITFEATTGMHGCPDHSPDGTHCRKR